eukprot:jgi/Botrbrau1/12597/Bobra.0169s0125.1
MAGSFSFGETDDQIPIGWLPRLLSVLEGTAVFFLITGFLLLIVIGCWWLLYSYFLKDLAFVQELLGKKKAGKISKEQAAAEIALLKKQHSIRKPSFRGTAPLPYDQSGNLVPSPGFHVAMRLGSNGQTSKRSM